MYVDWERDIMDQDGLLKYFDYGERMEKLFPVIQEAKENHKKAQIEFKLNNRTCQFMVDSDGTGVLRYKPVTGGWF